MGSALAVYSRDEAAETIIASPPPFRSVVAACSQASRRTSAAHLRCCQLKRTKTRMDSRSASCFDVSVLATWLMLFLSAVYMHGC